MSAHIHLLDLLVYDGLRKPLLKALDTERVGGSLSIYLPLFFRAPVSARPSSSMWKYTIPA
jgi:hypothetical protein